MGKEQNDLEQRKTGQGRGHREVGSLPKAMPPGTPATNPGFNWSKPSPRNSTYWWEEKPELNVFWKKQELHSLLPQCSRTAAVTQSSAGKNEKSTRSHVRNMSLLELPFFHLTFQ